MTNNQKTIAQGAEGIISLISAWDNREVVEVFKPSIEQRKIARDYLGNESVIIKNRIKKSYRIPALDEKIRKSRTKAEAKIINKLAKIIPVPKIIKTDDKEEIIMEYIDGKKLSDNLESLNYKSISKMIGQNIAKMHNQGIIHGDLTTSNMIYVDNKSKNKTEASLKQSSNISRGINITDNISKVYFIDFGLGFHSNKIEDKAVDLHLLKQALEAKHFTIEKECYNIIIANYKPEKYKEILARIKVIESRGRYKDKY
jgi:tRNA A-37 threonylcarbamoyl transferase component Bud32